MKRRSPWPVKAACALIPLVSFLGCLGSRAVEDLPVDRRFGHRYVGLAPDGYQTLSITSEDSTRHYFYYPVVFDSVFIRPAPFEATLPSQEQEVVVEMLLKGALPDACTEMHEVVQDRTGHIINLTVRMRRPQGITCGNLRQPYRFYVMLTGHYRPGHYTLKINRQELAVFPFEVRGPP